MERQIKEHPLPPPLPITVTDWLSKRDMKTERTLNDYIEDVHVKLLGNGETEGTLYRAYLYATYDEQAVEGSLSADNVKAAEMIREAALTDSPIKHEKLATISKALGVVLRRYHESRKERRQRVGDEVVPNETE
jgi:hypothetical protein